MLPEYIHPDYRELSNALEKELEFIKKQLAYVELLLFRTYCDNPMLKNDEEVAKWAETFAKQTYLR